MDRLYSPGGCPWDREQTHVSLVRYLLEEAHELADAIETDDRAGMREELGDLLLQVLFHARIASEEPDPFTVDDVAADLAAKLVRRHPHVFADADATDLHGQWDAIKKARSSARRCSRASRTRRGARPRAEGPVSGRSRRPGRRRRRGARGAVGHRARGGRRGRRRPDARRAPRARAARARGPRGGGRARRRGGAARRAAARRGADRRGRDVGGDVGRGAGGDRGGRGPAGQG